MTRGWFDRVHGSGPGALRSDSGGRLSLTVPALSAVVYRAEDHVPRSRRAPDISLRLPSGPARGALTDRPGSLRRRRRAADRHVPALSAVVYRVRRPRPAEPRAPDISLRLPAGPASRPCRDRRVGQRRLVLRGHVPRAQAGGAGRRSAPTTTRRTVSSTTSPTSGRARRIEYKAVVLDNAGHTRTSRARTLTVAPPAIALEAPPDGGRVRGTVEVRAIATPEHAAHVVTIQRRSAAAPGRQWAPTARPRSTPRSTTRRGLPTRPRCATGRSLTYAPGGRVTSEPRTVTVVQTPVTTAIVHYRRPAGDYGRLGPAHVGRRGRRRRRHRLGTAAPARPAWTPSARSSRSR